MGLLYGCPVEDVITGLSIQCRGWKSVYFNPLRNAFLGVAPNTLPDILVQHKRWSEGDLQIFFSRYSPAWYIGMHMERLVWSFKWDILPIAFGLLIPWQHYITLLSHHFISSEAFPYFHRFESLLRIYLSQFIYICLFALHYSWKL